MFCERQYSWEDSVRKAVFIERWCSKVSVLKKAKHYHYRSNFKLPHHHYHYPSSQLPPLPAALPSSHHHHPFSSSKYHSQQHTSTSTSPYQFITIPFPTNFPLLSLQSLSPMQSKATKIIIISIHAQHLTQNTISEKVFCDFSCFCTVCFILVLLFRESSLAEALVCDTFKR